MCAFLRISFIATRISRRRSPSSKPPSGPPLVGTAERLQKLETAIVDAFAVMNRNLAAASFNFCNDLKYTLPEFLVLFHAIFTLNQDLLLEKHYLYPPQVISLAGTRRWLRGYLPGVDEIPSPAQSGLYDPLLTQWRPQSTPTATPIDPRSQPYFKLHGSMNWTDPTGGRLLVMGGNKPTTMRRHPILTPDEPPEERSREIRPASCSAT